MKCKWLLDKDMLDSAYHDSLTDVLTELGYDYDVVKYIPLAPTYKVAPYTTEPKFDNNDCVVSYGSIEFLTALGFYEKLYYPSYYMDKVTLSCKNYLSKIPSKYLLNSNFIMLPYGTFKERKDSVYELLNTNKLFIRPDSGLKTFAGTTIHQEEFDYEINSIENLTSVLDETLILIANIKPIKREYRIVVGKGDVIASSMYKEDDKLNLKEGAPEKALELATKIARLEYQPDFVYTVDFAELTDGSCKVIELNSFSAAGLYACNLYDVVKGVSKIAEEDYKDYIGD